MILDLYYFFFQAEDGIRDRNVTGVQTCALPILNNGVIINGAVSFLIKNLIIKFYGGYNMNNNQKELPLITLRGITVYPSLTMNLDVGRKKSVKAIEAAMEQNKEILL